MKEMKYTPQDILRLCRQFFGLSDSCTEEELKSAFRANAKKLHPDINPLAQNKFLEMKEAYDFIMSQKNFFSNKYAVATNGVLLSSLGLGLGLKNGKDCNICQHKGYVVHTLEDMVLCHTCSGHGVTDYHVCGRCGGTGTHLNKNGDAQFSCFKCKGTGRIKGFPYTRCVECKGYGWVNLSQGQRVEYEVCYQCKGTGEIEIFNPVLPKGLLRKSSIIELNEGL